MVKKVKRFITGHNAAGKSILIGDDPAHNVSIPAPMVPELAMTNLWVTQQAPANAHGNPDPTDGPMPLAPPRNGTIFRIVEFPPDASFMSKLSQQVLDDAWDNIGHEQKPNENTKPPHPFMHKTDTVDYAIVLSGEIYLILDESEHLMQTGDVAIQRATNHAWSNRSDQSCRVAFVLIDADEK